MAIEYDRINFKNLPDTTTPLSAENLNIMDSAIDELVTEVNSQEQSISDMAHIKKYVLSGTTISFPVPTGNALILVARNITALFMKISSNEIDPIIKSSSITSATYDSTTGNCTIVSNNQYTHEVIVIY